MENMTGTGQITGANAAGLVELTTTAARNAATHKHNCDQLAGHARMIGNLLEKIKRTDLMKLPATAEPLSLLEEALRKALDLVTSCRDRSFLYMLALGWAVVYQFRQAHNEIDRYLKLLPLISLVHEFRIWNVEESLEAVEEDLEAHNAILKPDRSKKDANVLEKSLSRRYPNLQFQEALQEEKGKLQQELDRLRENNDPEGCRVIEHLIDVTQNVVNAPDEKLLAYNLQPYSGPGWVSTTKFVNGSKYEDRDGTEWRADLFGCCSEPFLSMKACIYPCGIFSRIANVVSEGQMCASQFHYVV